MDENEPPKDTASNSDNNATSESRKRKSYSPSSKPGPKSSKQPKLTGQEMVKIPNNDLLNSVTSNADASIDSLAENGSDNDKSSRPKRTQKQQKITDFNFEAKEIEDDELVSLENDQMKHPPQHEPGKEEDFPATLKRTKYFSEVLALKIGKYNHLNSFKPTSSLKHIPLAMTIAGFTHYYWPGRVICCGLIRPTVTELEKHINRAHRPPKPLPILSVPPGGPKEESESEDEKIEDKIVQEATKSSDKKSLKLPAGIYDDQNRYPPQHKPELAEDFKANDETIDYFLEVLKLKREKYGQLNLKDKAASVPLSLGIGQFMQYYWPGMLNCCGRVFSKCKEFQAHISASHGSKGKALKPTVLPEDVPVVRMDDDAMDRSPSVSPLPPPKSNRRNRSSTATNGSNGSGPSHASYSASPTKPSGSRNDPTSVEDRPINTSMAVPAKLEAVQEEARKLRRQSEQVQTLKDLMPVLVRVLELGAALSERTRSLGTTDRDDQDERSNHIEVLEYVFNVAKNGIVRWEKMKSNSRDPHLVAVQYAYSTLPMFINWEQSKDLEMVENIIILFLNTTRVWSVPSTPNPTEEKKTPKPSSRRTTTKQEKRNSFDTPRQSSPEEEVTDVTPPSSSTKGKGSKGKDLKALQDFCRFANIAVTQNTKSRSGTGYKDNDGNFNAMYRYGISQILKLYCPQEVSHLKCCERVFDLNTLRVHVIEKHEGGGKSNKTESSIAPA